MKFAVVLFFAQLVWSQTPVMPESDDSAYAKKRLEHSADEFREAYMATFKDADDFANAYNDLMRAGRQGIWPQKQPSLVEKLYEKLKSSTRKRDRLFEHLIKDPNWKVR